jgi:hypothetical protein
MIPVWMAHDDDASVGDSGIESNENVAVSKERLSVTYSNIYPTRCNFTQFIYIWKLLYMFWVVPPPITRSAYNCIHSIWY